jgi:hypothetical protein
MQFILFIVIFTFLSSSRSVLATGLEEKRMDESSKVG